MPELCTQSLLHTGFAPNCARDKLSHRHRQLAPWSAAGSTCPLDTGSQSSHPGNSSRQRMAAPLWRLQGSTSHQNRARTRTRPTDRRDQWGMGAPASGLGRSCRPGTQRALWSSRRTGDPTHRVSGQLATSTRSQRDTPAVQGYPAGSTCRQRMQCATKD